MTTLDALNLQEWGAARAEARVECLREDMRYCAAAVDAGPGGVSIACQELKCTRNHVSTLARAFHAIGPDAIDTDVPDSLLNAVMEAAQEPGDEIYILEWAIANGHHARAVRDAYDIAKGRRVSRVPLTKQRTTVALIGQQIVVDAPGVSGFEDGWHGEADVAIYPVLEL